MSDLFMHDKAGLNPFLVRVGVGTSRRNSLFRACVLIPSWLGWVLELGRWRKPPIANRLNPFLVRVGVGTKGENPMTVRDSLNPFLVRVGVGTTSAMLTKKMASVLIPSWLGWVLEPLTKASFQNIMVLIPSWLGWVLELSGKCRTH